MLNNTYLREQKMQPIQITLHCDKCNEEMKWDGRCLTTKPVQYPHVCTNCGNKQNIFGKKYPYIKYEKIGKKYAVLTERR